MYSLATHIQTFNKANIEIASQTTLHLCNYGTNLMSLLSLFKLKSDSRYVTFVVLIFLFSFAHILSYFLFDFPFYIKLFTLLLK